MLLGTDTTMNHIFRPNGDFDDLSKKIIIFWFCIGSYFILIILRYDDDFYQILVITSKQRDLLNPTSKNIPKPSSVSVPKNKILREFTPNRIVHKKKAVCLIRGFVPGLTSLFGLYCLSKYLDFHFYCFIYVFFF